LARALRGGGSEDKTDDKTGDKTNGEFIAGDGGGSPKFGREIKIDLIDVTSSNKCCAVITKSQPIVKK